MIDRINIPARRRFQPTPHYKLITNPDNTAHEGGVWKLWDNKNNVGTKTGRLTTDRNLNAID